MKQKKFYMLFLYGDLGTPEVFGGFINALLDTVSEDNVKYVHDGYTAICHFTSTETLESLVDLLNEVFDETVSAFFIMERPEKLGIRLSDDIEKHLFDLTTKSIYGAGFMPVDEEFLSEFYEWNEGKINELGLDDKFRAFDDEEDDYNDVLKIKKQYIEPLRMDNILDKISAQGVDSLTSEEKKYLKNLSK